MNSFLLNRQLGSIDPQAFASAQNDRLVRALQLAPGIEFGRRDGSTNGVAGSNANSAIAHAAGVNSIAIDRFEGRYLLSGGADSSVAIWDLEAGASAETEANTLYSPLDRLSRTSKAESLGITHLSFYPFDSLAFLTSGYDRHLKLFSSDPLAESASFDLSSIIYSHAVSTVASHLLVACATQHPAVRLVDLRSGANTHSLAGHAGSVLAVSWHPREEHVLASGATDGSVRLWDVRRSASSLGTLDMDDHVGVEGFDDRGSKAVRRNERGRAHNGAVNGISWTDDGQCLVSAGHDEKMRVWDMRTGANTLANFGPGLKNSTTTALFPLLAPSGLCLPGKDVVFYPNPREILCFDLHAGTLLSRLRIPGAAAADSVGGRNGRPRTTSLAWRAHAIEMCSAHTDGTIRTWKPRTWEDNLADQEDGEVANARTDEEVSERKRKREELDQIVRDLTGKRVTYS